MLKNVYTHTNNNTGRVEFGFGQADYSGLESDGVTIEVIRRDINVGNFVVTISPLSYTQFENMGLPLPSELPISMRPSDPAERKYYSYYY